MNKDLKKGPVVKSICEINAVVCDTYDTRRPFTAMLQHC